MVKTRQVDDKRRVVLPEQFEPGSDVLIEQVDEDTWLVTRYRKQTKLKMVKLRSDRRAVQVRKPASSWDKEASGVRGPGGGPRA